MHPSYYMHLLSAAALGQCPPLSPRRDLPRGANDLRPDDVDLVLALGDSVTVGFGMEGGLAEYRGRSFSAGGDPGVTTLPNLLRTHGHNTKLRGFSLGVRPGIHTSDEGCRSDNVSICGLNAAVDGASVARLLPQIGYLSARLRGQEDKWKLATVFSGLADVVFSAESSRLPTSPESFREAFRRFLQELKAELGGRLFLNVIGLPQRLRSAEAVVAAHESCRLIHAASQAPWSPIRWTPSTAWPSTAEAYNTILSEEVATHQAVRGPDDVFVAYHEFMRDVELKDELLEHLDCFHPNALFSGRLAVALWNSMLGSEQSTTINFTAPAACPTERTRLGKSLVHEEEEGSLVAAIGTSKPQNSTKLRSRLG